jgi:hypothetical protein
LAVSDRVPAVRRTILFSFEKQKNVCLQHSSCISPHAQIAFMITDRFANWIAFAAARE